MSKKILIALFVGFLIISIGCTLPRPEGIPDEAEGTGFGEENIEDFNQTWTEGSTSDYIVAGNIPWIVYAIIAIFIMAMACLILYMFGLALNIRAAKQYAKKELLQALASAILISFIVFLLYQIVIIMVGSFFGGESAIARVGDDRETVKEPIEIAKLKVQEKIDKLDTMWKQVYDSNEQTERMASECFRIIGITFYCNDWVGSIRKQVGMAHTLGDRIVTLNYILHIEYGLIEYIFANMLKFFLPIGLVLRVFPPTRGIGGLFIALAIGFYFIFPTLLFILDPSYSRPDVTLPDTFDEDEMKKCYTGFKGAIALTTSSFNIDRGGLSLISYEAVGNRLTYLKIEALFIPFIAFVITLVFVRTLSSLFGAAPAHMMRIASKFR